MAKPLPVAEISSENAHPESLLTRGLKTIPAASQTQAMKELTEHSRASSAAKLMSERDPIDARSKDPGHSRPIAIRYNHGDVSNFRGAEVLASLAGSKAEDVADGTPHNVVGLEVASAQIQLIRVVAPWLTIINPSNPGADSMDLSSRLGRWHHVFPRPLHISNIKWKSLCSPASIPLTTEGFPSRDQFKSEHKIHTYSLSTVIEQDFPSADDRTCLLREII